MVRLVRIIKSFSAVALTKKLGFPIFEVSSGLDFSGESPVRLDAVNFFSAGVLPT